MSTWDSRACNRAMTAFGRARWKNSVSDFLALLGVFSGCGGNADPLAVEAPPGQENPEDTQKDASPSKVNRDAEVDQDLDAGPHTVGDAEVDHEMDASADIDGHAEVERDMDADTDGGAGSADSPDGSVGRCAEQAVRCSAETGFRERCEAGSWVEQDFICAISVRVRPGDGVACAVKANETAVCWWSRSQLRVYDFSMPELPGPLHSLELVRDAYHVVAFTHDGHFLDYDEAHIEGVEQFDATSADSCWVTKEGLATCSKFGPITTSAAIEVATTLGRHCALLDDDRVVCHRGFGELVELAGRYTTIEMGPYQVCGVDMAGEIWCTDLQDETLTPWSPLDGIFTTLAVTDGGVCGMLSDGELRCARGLNPGAPQTLYQPSGTFTHLDAGDSTICGIRTDGSVACWQEASSEDEIDSGLVPDGW